MRVTDGDSLPIIQSDGFTAVVDAFAWEPDPDPNPPRMRLWFLSLLGAQQALKAIWARLLKGEVATFSRQALGQVHFCVLAPEGPKGWRSFTASLPAAGGHQLVLLPDAARHAASRDDFVLLPRFAAEAPAIHYRFLDRRVDLPLHPSWQSWLWERALDTGEARPLEAEGILAYRCHPDSLTLADDISDAIRRGLLDLPDTSKVVADGTNR